MSENNTITDEQIKDVYQKLMDYCNYQLNVFETQIQAQIVEHIKQKIFNEKIYNWNQASLTDYINNIIYMIKGQQFARTINSFTKEFIVNKLREDFGEEIYNNAKKALNLHEIYYKNITIKRRLKKVITNFKDKWDNTDGLWKNEFFEGLKSYKNLNINASYGMGNRLVLPKTPYLNFLKTGFTTNRGIYPYISYLYDKNKFEVGISISRDNKPDLNDLIIIKINEYEKKYFNTDDLDLVIDQLDTYIDDFLNILDSKPHVNDNQKAIKMSIRNIILYGAPGVGKTHNTNKLISLIDGGKSEKEIFDTIKQNNNGSIHLQNDLKSRVKFITFHQSFGYEDFIEGFRPNNEGNIKIKKGIFHNICTEAIQEENKDTNYYLVIDEINRGNISKIFGELITLIEEDKREKIEVTLPYSKEPFKVPSNLFIIGTMNSTDKSIALIDIALRRRFTFLKMKPNSELIKFNKAKAIFDDLNKKIIETIGEDYQIGHSYFMNISNDADLEFVLEYKITPLLEEYFYGNKEQLEEILLILK